jgi:hypothetical protein
MHHICESEGVCYQYINAQQLAVTTAMGPHKSYSIGGLVQNILAASCRKCQKDQTGADNSKMSKCSGCKLTRLVFSRYTAASLAKWASGTASEYWWLCLDLLRRELMFLTQLPVSTRRLEETQDGTLTISHC